MMGPSNLAELLVAMFNMKMLKPWLQGLLEVRTPSLDSWIL